MQDETEEIRFIDLFGGVGGFRLGLEKTNQISINSKLRIRRETRQPSELLKSDRVSEKSSSHNGKRFRCVWYNDIDKYATTVYNHRFKENYEATDIRQINTEDIPDHDLLCAGFPCQAFSVAGRRKGFEDTRGTLFYQICRVAWDKRPSMLLLENVKGLLNHDEGATYATILRALDELGYDAEWQVLNSKNYGVPQNRERVFIIGHLRGQGRQQIFPLQETNGVTKQNTRQISYSKERGCFKNGNGGNKSLPMERNPCKNIMRVGGLYDKDGEVGKATVGQGEEREVGLRYAFSIDSSYYKGADGKRTMIRTRSSQPYRDRNYTPPLRQSDKDEVRIMEGTQIRRLTPRECERLQGFPDDWTLVPYGKGWMSDTQRYKQMGNAITVNVVEAIGKRMIEIFIKERIRE